MLSEETELDYVDHEVNVLPPEPVNKPVTGPATGRFGRNVMSAPDALAKFDEHIT